MSKDFYNAEHYPDPTPYQAMKNIDRERFLQMIREIKAVMNKHGFELVARVQVRDKKTGKIYK